MIFSYLLSYQSCLHDYNPFQIRLIIICVYPLNLWISAFYSS